MFVCSAKVNPEEKRMLAFCRWDQGGPGVEVVFIANFFHEPQDDDVFIQTGPMIKAGAGAVALILAGAIHP
jgi:hypothetical protein